MGPRALHSLEIEQTEYDGASDYYYIAHYQINSPIISNMYMENQISMFLNFNVEPTKQ